jgi:5-methylcytosine-specific restriction endonuclease McrA
MPLGRICPGCKKIFTGPSCPRRCRPGGKRLTLQRTLNHKIYATRAHKAQRLRVLERDGYRCVDCGHTDTTGKTLIADHVHGIDREREFDDAELVTRCQRHSGLKDGARGKR